MASAYNKKRILLVDDDRSVTEMLRMLLETRGYDVKISQSGRDAYQMASDHTDLILLDLVLPDEEGFEVCRKLKQNKKTRHIPIIILSAKLLSEDIVEGLYLGADDYLTKPFEYEELVARMEAVMRRSSIFHNGNMADKGEEAIIRELHEIIEKESIVPFYQPIFMLEPVKILGLEVLTRPKTNGILSNPEILFKAAIQFGFYQELEMLSWKKALENAAMRLKEEKLFFNCNPYLVEGQKFLTIKSLFDRCGFSGDKVVLEITERSAISDFRIFYGHLKAYRDYGFQFAVDDVGGGYASLESIIETRPEIIKIDRHIVSNIEKDAIKMSIVKFITSFCRENNILSVAEGIETKTELETIRTLGVDAGQGYYLYRPTPDIKTEEMLHYIRTHIIS